MTIKSSFSQSDFEQILSQYQLGSLLAAEPIPQGNVQTNFFISTTQGKFVFRYYENRPKPSVLFEIEVLLFLQTHHFPSPCPMPNTAQEFVGVFKDKPFVLFSFLEGQPVSNPQETHKKQIVQKAAELQNLTLKFKPRYMDHRWNYTPDFCRQMAFEKAQKLNTSAAWEKFIWLEEQLHLLQFPASLPKAICHCDFHFSNTLFQGEQLAALLDFDDANYTYAPFDLVCLVDQWGWSFPEDTMDIRVAANIVATYNQYRQLSSLEQHHLFDIFKLSILIDCLWFFARGSGEDFYERRKIDFLNRLGREQFETALFRNQLPKATAF
jgi:homoserine kinase type II